MPRRAYTLAVDCETVGLNWWKGDRPFAVSMCKDDGDTYLWRWKVDPSTRKIKYPKLDIHNIRELILHAERVVYHNAKFDIRMMSEFVPPELVWDKLEDTLLASHVLNSKDNHGLKELALKYLDILDDDEKRIRKETQSARTKIKNSKSDSAVWSLGDSLEEDYWIPGQLDPSNKSLDEYATRDAVRTMALWGPFQEELDRWMLTPLYEREKQLLRHVYEMEEVGVNVRTRALYLQRAEYRAKADEAERKLTTLSRRLGMKSFNVRSPAQVCDLLFLRAKCPVLKSTAKGNASVDAGFLVALEISNDYQSGEVSPSEARDLGADQEVLDKLAFEGIEVPKAAADVADLILNYRRGNKACEALDSYDNLKDTSRYVENSYVIHPGLNQTGTSTTRFSCSRPNAHNVSKKAKMPLRKSFGPPPGYVWYDIDYDQLELRIYAAAANELALIEAFDRGDDVHMFVACEMFQLPPDQITPEMRRSAKAVNFGVIYGAKQWKIFKLTGDKTAYSRYIQRFPAQPRFMAEVIAKVEQVGHVNTLSGYRLYVDRRQAYAGVDYIVQGTAGDIMKQAILNVGRSLETYRMETDEHVRMVLTVHDELVVQAEKKHSAKHREPGGLLSKICELMMAPGKYYGVHTPVSVALVDKEWSSPKEIEVLYAHSADHSCSL